MRVEAHFEGLESARELFVRFTHNSHFKYKIALIRTNFISCLLDGPRSNANNVCVAAESGEELFQ